MNKKSKIFRDNNIDLIRKKAKESRIKNAHSISESQRKWNQNNKEWRKKWELENRKKRAGYSHKYRTRMTEEQKLKAKLQSAERCRKWRELNPDYAKAYISQYRKTNKEKFAAIVRNYKSRKKRATGYHTGEDVKSIIKAQDGLCFWCFLKIDKIHIDHYIPLKKGGSNDPSNLVASCAKCNQSKGAKMPWDFMPERYQQSYLSIINEFITNQPT